MKPFHRGADGKRGPVLHRPRPLPLGRPLRQPQGHIYTTDEALRKAFPDNDGLRRWLTLARDRVQFQGLPARICWLGLGERAKAGLLFNNLVATGKVGAPIVIGRDHLDCGFARPHGDERMSGTEPRNFNTEVTEVTEEDRGGELGWKKAACPGFPEHNPSSLLW